MQDIPKQKNDIAEELSMALESAPPPNFRQPLLFKKTKKEGRKGEGGKEGIKLSRLELQIFLIHTLFISLSKLA